MCLESADKIFIFFVLKQWLLQQREIEASFVHIIIEIGDSVGTREYHGFNTVVAYVTLTHNGQHRIYDSFV